MGRTTRIAAALLVLPVALGLVPAWADEGPNERASLSTDPELGPEKVRLGVEGNVGAYDFDSAVEATPNHVRVEDIPMYGAIQLDEDGRRNEYEELYGPRVANATIGTGGITQGLDAHARLTNLAWPGPGLHEHVNYRAATRRWDNQGAPENAGSFGGVVLPDGTATWLHPSFGWTRAVDQTYASSDDQTVVTRLRKGADGRHVDVTITDVVHPEKPIIARNFTFTGPGVARRAPRSFAYFANMNPTTSRAPRVPSVFDGIADDGSDFGTVYDAESASLLHFRPYKVDPASLSRLATSRPSDATVSEAVTGSFGPGVYIAVAGQEAAVDHQAGHDSAGLVREGPAEDPFYDFVDDGRLSGSPGAFGKTSGAIVIPPDRTGPPGRSFTVFLAAAETTDTTRELVEEARSQRFGTIRSASEAYWGRWLHDARLPDGRERVRDVAKRALMAVRTAQDRETGAIVANTTTQTPYRQDWVRDGAFFNYALLLAGKTDMVLDHNAFYESVYRPGGTWDSFYFTDGAEAGAVFPYEIDSQAFALWALWLPYEFEVSGLDGSADPTTLDGDGTDYLERVYPAIRDTADALMLCSDPSNGMQCYAPEDDAYQPTQGPQGAATVHLALQAAAEAAAALDRSDEGTAWRNRADELRTAAVDQLCNEENGPGEMRCGSGRGGIYMAWPSNLLRDAVAAGELEPSDLQGHLRQYVRTLDRHSRTNDRKPDAGGAFQYPMEPILALAPRWGHHLKQTRLEGWNDWLVDEVAAPGVLHYAERIYRCGTPGALPDDSPCGPDQEYLHTVGFPHIWSGVEQYMATAFVDGLDSCADGVTRVGEAACPVPATSTG